MLRSARALAAVRSIFAIRGLALLAGLALVSCAPVPVAPTPTDPPLHSAVSDRASASAAATASAATATAADASSQPAPDPRVAALEAHARALVAEVARHRGLSETTPLDIRFEDAATFRRSLERAADQDTSDPEVERAKWVAFGLAPPASDPKAIGRAVLDEQVAAFYDSKEKQLHVPIDAPAGAGEQAALEAEVILAHEIEHGLQDEHFPMPDFDTLPDDDSALALRATYEGDATFVMVAVPAARRGPLDGARLLEAARTLGRLPLSALASMSGKQSPKLEESPRIVRDQLLIPYFGGMVLAAELYQQGGYARVDQLFLHPPESSAQILHPEKYFAGERPIAVAPPTLPPGLKQLSRGRMGELGLRSLLGGCLSETAAAQAAEGWGGDAYLIAVAEGGAMQLLWSTTWESEQAAARFGEALQRGRGRCFPLVSASGASSWTLDAGAHWKIEGRSVALVRGVAAADRAAELERLIRLVPEAAPDAGSTNLLAPQPGSKSAPAARVR